ncbi:MAG: outer membrane beta-barrel protein [Rhodobacteraceae bacterium]|nr:outer membrane beta-barrel protein [Paracoccaceae bacterium]
MNAIWKKIIALGVGTIFGFAPLSSIAEPLPMPGQSESDWRYTLTPYAFLPARTTGTSTIAGQSVPLDLDFKDALDLLDFALAATFEMWRGDFGIIVDANYVRLKADGSLPSPPGATFAVDIRQKWLGVLAAYRVVDSTYGVQNQRYSIDLQGGIRYNSLRQTVDIPVGQLGGDEGWFEPVIGARAMWRLSEKWAAAVALDLGGFGAGGNDLQVGLNAGFDYRLWKKNSLRFGYRYYSMDYSTTLATGPFAYDVRQHGPYLGVTFRF